MENIKFQPTKTWLREHRRRPKQCTDLKCVCVMDFFNDDSIGFCTGWLFDNDGQGLDIISFCNIGFEPGKGPTCHRALWHPAECLLAQTAINFAVQELWLAFPWYRAEVGRMKQKRKQALRKLLREKRSGGEPDSPPGGNTPDIGLKEQV
jgi:hypothetical protein